MLFRDKIALEVQRIASFVLLIFFGPVIHVLYRFKFRYSAQDLAGIRARFRDIRRQHPGPMLLCSNHLTLVDSIVQGVILNSLGSYMTRVSALAWNLPERKNFNHDLGWRMTCYLGRCIPVTRGASAEDSRRVQEKMKYVLNRGDIISIFPEGKRSRDGRVDDEDFSYGTGQLLRMVPEAKVLCVYMRGLNEGGFGDWPAVGERFFLDMTLIEPTSQLKGLRQTRDLSRQIIAQLKTMEDRFFAGALAIGQ